MTHFRSKIQFHFPFIVDYATIFPARKRHFSDSPAYVFSRMVHPLLAQEHPYPGTSIPWTCQGRWESDRVRQIDGRREDPSDVARPSNRHLQLG